MSLEGEEIVQGAGTSEARPRFERIMLARGDLGGGKRVGMCKRNE